MYGVGEQTAPSPTGRNLGNLSPSGAVFLMKGKPRKAE